LKIFRFSLFKGLLPVSAGIYKVNSKSPGRLTENIIISLKPTIMKVKRIFFLLALLPVLFLVTGCDNDDEDTPTPVPQEEMDIEDIIANSPVDPYTIALELIEQTGWTIENEVDIEAGDIQLMNYQRNLIGGDIAHYYFEVSVGADPHDKVGIHRLVKESGGSPIKTEKTFFFLHGDAKNFVGMMLPGLLSPNMADDFGMGVYLARNNVDVWGIDQAWTLVPQETMEFGFMQDWGLEKTATDLLTGMAIARVTRYLIGNELSQMIMSGYSSGVPTGFLACGMESQMDAGLRHIKGYVPIDYAALTDNPDFAGFSEADLMTQQASYDAGTYQSPIPFALVGNLSRTDPEGDSPILPGFTNFQVAMFYGAGPFIPNVTFHYFAGIWEDDSPIGLQYVTLEQFYDFMESAIPYQPVKFFIDYQSMAAGEDNPFDDHFGDISVPILNVSPAGGFGELSKYQYTVVGSTDVTHLIPALRPAGEEHLDFGHIDIFMANNAESVIWEDLLDWVNAR
jgi:hypothetical protein